jgi:hypothetical protein
MARYSIGGWANEAAASATVGIVISRHGWAAGREATANEANVAANKYRGVIRVIMGRGC